MPSVDVVFLDGWHMRNNFMAYGQGRTNREMV